MSKTNASISRPEWPLPSKLKPARGPSSAICSHHLFATNTRVCAKDEPALRTVAKGCSSRSDDGLENLLVEAMHDQLGLGWFWLDGGSRFSAYSPLRVYCGRLMMPCE